MDVVSAFLTDFGYAGMLIAAFLAGSFFPFSSETVMVALLAAGLDAQALIVYGSIGNIAGGMFNYFIGRQGKTEWIERYLHVKHENIELAQKWTEGYGAWIGFFAFVPILGSAITIALGLMRANIPVSVISIALGKTLRYILLIRGAEMLF